MRCSEVTQELAAPTRGSISAEMAEHLAACSQCSAWAARAKRFNQLWQATRTADPSSATFDMIWGQIRPTVGTGAEAQPHAPAQTLVFEPKSRRSSWKFAAAILSQAAVLLVALTMAWISTSTPSIAFQVKPEYSADEGESLILRVGTDGVQELRREQEDLSQTVQVAAEHDVFNYMESLGSL
jgi:hypothetical protein